MTKTYKHKQTGDVAELVNTSGYKLNKSTIGLIPVEYIENSNDWELVVENRNPFNLEVGQTYTVLYKHCKSAPLKVKITRFTEMGHAWGEFENGSNGIVTDSYILVKEKPVLFITEDNVEIREGDNYVTLTEDFRVYGLKSASTTHIQPYPKAKLFSTRQKAEEYILMNKPCLSINDVKLCFGKKSSITEELETIVKSRI